MLHLAPVGSDIYLISFSSFVDMKEQFVYDPLISKRQQYLLATQVCISIDLWVSLSLHYASQLVRAVLKIGQSLVLMAVYP